MNGYLKMTLPALVFGLMLTSCEQTLTEDEKKVITTDIPKEMFREIVMATADELDDFLWDGVVNYAEETGERVQRKIDERNRTAAFLGGNMFDFAELFGTSTNEIYAREYNNYILYANNHRSDLLELVNKMSEVIANNPSIAYSYASGCLDQVPMSYFQKVSSDLPSSINEIFVDGTDNLTMDSSDKVSWGEAVMGEYRRPRLSSSAVLCAVLCAMSYVDKPKAVYAVYDDEREAWEVGYNNKDTYFVTFEIKGDVLRYEYTPTRYSAELAKSELNALNK